MPLPEIDFVTIRPYDGSRNGGFEELCCQLAALEPRDAKAEFFRKGRGGDAGVECFVRAQNGAETAWQAKYVMSWSQGLLRALDDSIETALAKHPRLTKYVVCIPFDLSDARAGRYKTPLEQWEAWRSKWIADAKKRKRRLQIVLWSKSIIAERLARDTPAYAGRLAYWFNQQSYTTDWFRQQFEKARATLGSRYTPETNVELPIRRDFLGFARDPSVNAAIEETSLKVQESCIRALRAVRDAAPRKNPHARAIDQALHDLAIGLSNLPIPADQPFPVTDWTCEAENLRAKVQDALSWAFELPAKRSGQMGVSPAEWARHCLFGVSDGLSELLCDLSSERWLLANHRAVLLYGQAGTGKSHLLADVVEHHIACGYPGVLVLGGDFVDGEPWQQVLSQLGLPSTFQTKHFLAALDAAGQAAGVRAIICIDAINERKGIDVWPSRIAAFLQEAKSFPHVGIVLSCRSTYLPYVIPDTLSEEDLYRIEHTGFSGRAAEAAKIYLDKRGIVRPGAPTLVPEFENPLFLKTCCDYLEKEGKRELPKGITGVSQIFGFYVDAVARTLNQRMRLDHHLEVVPRAIGALASAIAAEGIGYIEKSKAIALFEAIHPSHNELERSLLSQLENEGVVAVEPIQQEGRKRFDEVRFTFERFSDHQIAKTLLDKYLKTEDAAGSFAQGSPLAEVVSGEEAYRRAGIIEALSVQLPERAGAELIDVAPEPDGSWLLHEAFVNSLLWRDQSRFTDRTYEILKTTTDVSQLTSILFSLATEPKNKFNANFLHGRLIAPSLPERDQRWSIFVNRSDDDDGGPINTLISWSLSNGLEAIDDERAELAGVALSWLFTASNRAIRDKATKALACLLAKRLALAGRLIRKFQNVNDPYVLERVLAASYGAILQGITVAGGAEFARAVYETLFENGAPPPNLLARDHASGILRYLAWRKELPKGIDMAKVLPPHRSPWPIEYVPDELIETYKQDYGKGTFTDSIVSSTINDGDFARYQIDHFAQHWTQATLGSGEAPTYGDIASAWLEQFKRSATPEQTFALENVLDAARAMGGKFYGYQETPETRKLKDAEAAWRTTITPGQWEEYRVRARGFIRHQLFDRDNRSRDSLALFDIGWARRWVCKRAHEFGWTPERFAEIERHMGVDHGRMEHRIERIGKKYQWLALYELGARLADHLEMRNESWRDMPPTQPYEGAWQVGIRNLDPSFLLTHTYYDGWAEWPRTWWVPVAPTLREMPRKERLIWRDTNYDIINSDKLIDVTDSKTGRRWLALSGFAHWKQRGLVDGEKQLQIGTWFRLSCVVVRQSDRPKLLKWLRTQRLTDPKHLPELELHGDQYLGEYPWHPSFTDLPDWEEPDQWHKRPVPVRATIATHLQERSGYDYSLDKSVDVTMPAPWLMKAMGLRLSNGRNLTYVSPDGVVRFFDPSVLEPGPSAALVDRDAFLEMLKREGLCALWVIAGEKDVYSGSRSDRGWGGTLAHTHIYELKNDGFACYKKIDIDKPSAEQLKAYLECENVRAIKKPKVQRSSSKRVGD